MRKEKILGTVMDVSMVEEDEALLEIYGSRIKSTVFNIGGEEVEIDHMGRPLMAEGVNIRKNHKVEEPHKRLYPVFLFHEENQPDRVIAIILPMTGNGLWDWISAYVAIDEQVSTILGVSFDHKAETPGLGARITEAKVQDRFRGKTIFEGIEASIHMVKGENHSGLSEHQVDGLSGATMTALGVNSMFKKYFDLYGTILRESVPPGNS